MPWSRFLESAGTKLTVRNRFQSGLIFFQKSDRFEILSFFEFEKGIKKERGTALFILTSKILESIFLFFIRVVCVHNTFVKRFALIFVVLKTGGDRLRVFFAGIQTSGFHLCFFIRA